MYVFNVYEIKYVYIISEIMSSGLSILFGPVSEAEWSKVVFTGLTKGSSSGQ